MRSRNSPAVSMTATSDTIEARTAGLRVVLTRLERAQSSAATVAGRPLHNLGQWYQRTVLLHFGRRCRGVTYLATLCKRRIAPRFDAALDPISASSARRTCRLRCVLSMSWSHAIRQR